MKEHQSREEQSEQKKLLRRVRMRGLGSRFRDRKVDGVSMAAQPSVNGSARSARIEFDLAEGGFVIRHVLLQKRHERLCLLRTEINSLKIMQLDLRFEALLHGAEDEKEIPHVDADLHTVGIGVAVVGGLDEFHIRLVRGIHIGQFTA